MPDIKTLWKNQKTEGTVTLATIHDNANRFQRVVSRRNMREYGAAAVVVLVFSWYVWALPGLLVKAGSVLCIGGVLYVVWQLRARASAELVPSESSALGLVDFQRRMLVRQRNALGTVWRWYLAPLIPGMLVLMTGIYVDAPEAIRSHVLTHLLTTMLPLFVLVFGGVWGLNAWGARRLQRKIDEFDSFE